LAQRRDGRIPKLECRWTISVKPGMKVGTGGATFYLNIFIGCRFAPSRSMPWQTWHGAPFSSPAEPLQFEQIYRSSLASRTWPCASQMGQSLPLLRIDPEQYAQMISFIKFFAKADVGLATAIFGTAIRRFGIIRFRTSDFELSL
jgi:hypothetical protein